MLLADGRQLNENLVVRGKVFNNATGKEVRQMPFKMTVHYGYATATMKCPQCDTQNQVVVENSWF
jgi:hypothetical protein